MIQSAIHQVAFNGTLDGIKLSCGKLDMLDVFFTGFVLNGVVVILHMEEHVLKLGKGCMDRLLLDDFQQFMVILNGHMPAV